MDGTTASVVALAGQSGPEFKNGDDGSFYVPKPGVLASLDYGDPAAVPPKAYLPAADHSGKGDWIYGPSSRHPHVVNHLFADGSVRSLAAGIDPAVYMGQFSRDGGELVRGDF